MSREGSWPVPGPSHARRLRGERSAALDTANGFLLSTDPRANIAEDHTYHQ